jgi:hypothetical protein
LNRVRNQVKENRIDAIEGRSPEQIKNLLDASHRAILAALGVPERDRYQIYHEHPATNMVVLDTGLGIARTRDVLVFSITSSPREEEKKLALYGELVRELESSCGIKPSDVMISIVSNTKADWSFGNGEAQFITGKL